MTDQNKAGPQVIMLPPTLVLLHVTAGLVLNWMFGLSFGHAWGWLGIALVAFSLATIFWAQRVFRQHNTNVSPNLPATAIVSEGPYRYTRNPMYLSFMAGFVGLCCLADAPLMLIAALPLYYILDRFVIIPEEAYLSEKFGDSYRNYKARVRRWI